MQPKLDAQPQRAQRSECCGREAYAQFQRARSRAHCRLVPRLVQDAIPAIGAPTLSKGKLPVIVILLQCKMGSGENTLAQRRFTADAVHKPSRVIETNESLLTARAPPNLGRQASFFGGSGLNSSNIGEANAYRVPARSFRAPQSCTHQELAKKKNSLVANLPVPTKATRGFPTCRAAQSPKLLLAWAAGSKPKTPRCPSEPRNPERNATQVAPADFARASLTKDLEAVDVEELEDPQSVA